MAVQVVSPDTGIAHSVLDHFGQPTRDWQHIGDVFGAQRAAYTAVRLGMSDPGKNKVHCQQCGKPCTYARGGFVLTRSTVVCGKCYDPAKHGEQSSHSNHGPTTDPATCRHERQDRTVIDKTGVWPPVKKAYCLDCWATLRQTGGKQ